MGQGPVIRNPTPDWMKPENASVFDSYWTKVARAIAPWIGADDVASQAMGIGAPLEIPGGQALGEWATGLAKAGAKKVGADKILQTAARAAEQFAKSEKGIDLRPAAIQGFGPAKWQRGQTGRYASTILTGRDAEYVMAALENVAKQYPSLKKALPEMAKALQAHPASAGTLANGVMREPESGLIMPTPQMMSRWARYNLYGEEIPANWGPLTQPGIREAFGPDSREIKLYADLWGAISPLNDPMVNTIQANRAQGRTLGSLGLSPMDEKEFQALGLGLPSRRPNVNRAMAGEPLEGPKVPRMSGMLTGTERLPPIDEHVVDATGGASRKWSEELPALRAKVKALTGDEYKGPAGELRLNKDLSEGLVAMWGAMFPDRHPLTSMAGGWEGVRSDKGIKSVGGPFDILRRLELHTPGAMLDPAKLGTKWPGGYISSGVLLPLLLKQWEMVTNGQPENQPQDDE